MDKIKVLIIDDEEDLTFFIKANLELVGNYEVITATTGKDGLAIAASTDINIILLDIMMPKMDGFEVLDKIKKTKGILSIPVIMLTAKGDIESKIKAAGLYNEDYIVKPVQIEILKLKIEEALKRRGIG
ncbi:MAG: response regulator [Candidatus Omnitrophica bacterium]|nr:response regulator [Candidatus Omnitrophota bacterium]